MKFAHKLAAVILLFLAIVLSIGGFWVINQSFSRALTQAVEQNSQLHVREKYSLEIAMMNAIKNEGVISSNTISTYARGVSRYTNENEYCFAVFSDKNVTAFSNMPMELSKKKQLEIIDGAENSAFFVELSGKNFMLISSGLSVRSGVQMHLLSAHDITQVFEDRDEQVKDFIQLELVAIVIAGLAAIIVSNLLTRNIKGLERTSKAIAGGKLSLRTNVKSQDEIGELGKSFNIMADAIEAQILELRQAVEERNDFVSAFTHELKTPMTSMLGYADILRSGRHDEETCRRAANFIYHESKRLEALSHKLMLLMGLDKTKTTLEGVDIITILSQVRRSLAGFPQVQFTSPKNIFVFADKELLCDLIINLAINAVKASDGDKKVLVIAHVEVDKLTISVIDRGCGIPKEELERITKPFYMIDKSRARLQNGSGMGLAICDKIAQLHGTSLNFVSEVGKGTAVSIYLQIAKEKQNETN